MFFEDWVRLRAEEEEGAKVNIVTRIAIVCCCSWWSSAEAASGSLDGNEP